MDMSILQPDLTPNAAHRGLWLTIEPVKNYTWELDDVILMTLVAILFSLWSSHGIIWSKPPKGQHLYFVSPQAEEEAFQNFSRGPQKTITRNIDDRMTELKKSIIVFWGSQSGKAERLANSFVQECTTRFNLPAMAANLDLFDYDQLGKLCEGRLVGFIVATYGEGGPTDNACGLEDYLRKVGKNGSQPLSRLQYFCFGLGNSKYQFYNVFVDFVDRALTSCGAQRIAPIGKIDEAHGSNDAWLGWKDEMVKILAGRFGSEERVAEQRLVFDLVNVDEGWGSKTAVSHVAETSTATNSNQLVSVKRSVQLSGSSATNDTKESLRTYLHIELEAKAGGQKIQYETGDHVAIWPINPNHEVALLASAFGWDKKTLKATIDIKPRNPNVDGNAALDISTPTTREALLHYQLDICGPVSPEVLDLLALHCPDADGKAYLDRCRSDVDSLSQILSQHLTCGQLMKRAAPGATWTEDAFCALLTVLPKLRPRYFSIASAPAVAPNSVAITAGLVETLIPQVDRPFVGLTSGYLRSLHLEKNSTSKTNSLQSLYNFDGPRSILRGYKLFAHIRKSTFKLPADIASPVLMVAAGSGIAPFRGFVQERMALSRQGKTVGKMTLFYGSRSERDCLYTDIWSEAERMGILETHYVFSARLVDGKKFYVQHELLRQAETTRQLIRNGGSVYICGSTDMANEVKTSIGSLLGDSGDVMQLKESGRLQEDVWA